jgi:rare lipoprotein A
MKILRIFVIFMTTLLFISVGVAQDTQVGKASYYTAHGHRTSSGIAYHKDSFTCAHRTLPFGTILKVHDLNTDKEVYVKVIDRGPFGRGRVIDLSYAAAKELDILHRGVTSVEITQVDDYTKIPYQADNSVNMPQLQVKSPDGAGYCTLPQWVEKKRKQELAKATARAESNAARRDNVRKLKKDSVPRWKIFDKLSASNEMSETSDPDYIVK